MGRFAVVYLPRGRASPTPSRRALAASNAQIVADIRTYYGKDCRCQALPAQFGTTIHTCGPTNGTRMVTEIWRQSDGPSEFNNCPCLTVANARPYFDKKVGSSDVEMWTVHTVDTANDTDFVYLPQVRRR